MDAKLALVLVFFGFLTQGGSHGTPWSPTFPDLEFGRKYNGPPPQEVMVNFINRLGLWLLDIHNVNNENNIALSPYGAASVLVAMTEGLRGDAALEIYRAAHVPRDLTVIRIGLRDIHRHLKSYFIPKEGFLAGLKLSHDNVTLNPTYERILQFYGYDVDSFNNALIPDMYTTTAGSPVNPASADSTSEGVVEPSTAPARPASVTEIPEEDAPRVTTVVLEREETTPIREIPKITNRPIPVTIPVVEITTPFIENEETTKIIPVVEITTIPPQENETTSVKPSITTANPPKTTPPIVATTTTPTVVRTTAKINAPTTELVIEPFTSVLINTSSNAESPKEVTEVSSATSTNKPAEEPLLDDKKAAVSTTEEAVASENEIASGSTEGAKEIPKTTVVPMTSTEEVKPTTQTSVTTTSGNKFPIITTPFVTTTPPGANKVTTIRPAKESTTTTATEAITTLPPDEVEVFNATQTTPESSRGKRSIIDYLIARYYDDRYTSRPNNFTHHHDHDIPTPPPRTFAINGLPHRKTVVRFMTYDTMLPFYYIPNLEALALSFPLDNTNYYLLLILPIQEDGVDDLICEMKRTPDLKYIIRNLKYTRVKAAIPSFMLKGYVNLTPTLQKLGIEKIFEPRRADFSPMTNEKDIYVTNVEQAITVTIRSYVDLSITSDHGDLRQYGPVEFNADHPFVYFVMDSELHVALMAGKIVDPLSSTIR